MTDQKMPLILVVDDYQDAREMYAEYLQYSGFRVAEARNGNEAVDQAFALKPDLILDVGSTSATFVSLAERVQAQTGIPYALLDGSFRAIPDTYRKLGALIGRPADCEVWWLCAA